jgi:glycosyltransferase involved in cell wall biosynthesis
MAHGRPVVASDTGGIREWLRHEETGLLVRPGDARSIGNALQRLIRDKKEARRMGETGIQVARDHFSERAYLRAITEVYEEARRHWLAAHAS